MRPQPVAVYVSWLSRGKRRWRRFDDPYQARRFYVQKEAAGAEPRLVRLAL
jgi:hypothetical protein